MTPIWIWNHRFLPLSHNPCNVFHKTAKNGPRGFSVDCDVHTYMRCDTRDQAFVTARRNPPRMPKILSKATHSLRRTACYGGEGVETLV